MNKTRLQYLLGKYLENTCSESEMKELFELFKRAEYESEIKQYLSEYWNQSQEAVTRNLSSQKEKKAWFHEIHSQALAREGGKTGYKYQPVRGRKAGLLSYSNKHSQWLKIAAILVFSLTLSLAYFHITMENTAEEVAYEVKTPGPGEKIRFTLPDGTQVHLNSESTLEYPVVFEGGNREVRLEGEAYFVVTRDEERPFQVHARDITTTVLGTTFNVRSYQGDSEVQVAVSSGKVAVSDSESQDADHQVVLVANQWANYETETRSFNTGSGDVTSLTAWNEGVLFYHDKELSEVAAQLERWYGVSILFDGDELKKCVIRGEHRDETLVNVLDAITYAFDITYQIEGRNVVLSGKGCF